MKPMQIVPYEAKYRESLLELYRTTKTGTEIGGISRHDEDADLKTIEQMYLRAGGDFIVGLIDDMVIAMAGYQKVSDDTAELTRIRVKMDLRGQGYGSQMLDEIERLAAASGVSTIFAETAKERKRSLDFFSRHGYETTGISHSGQVETIQFSKQLNIPANSKN